MTTDEKLEAFVPPARVRRLDDGRTAEVYTAPVVSHATGEVCFGVKYDADGSRKIGKAGEFEVVA